MESKVLLSRLRPRTSSQWIQFFEANLQKLLDLPWHLGASWSEIETAHFAASLQEFQLGESSEGKQLIARAHTYAERIGDTDYEKAIRLFIQEEQRHSRLLAEFLLLAGVPLMPHSRLDRWFRRLRRLAGLEVIIIVLVVAETIGKVYYHALRQATGSPLLRRLCDQLLRDEVMHLRFHAERLALLRRGRALWKNTMARFAHGLLLRGTSVAVWAKHRGAFRAAGLGFWEYWQRCGRENRTLLERCRPDRYEVSQETNLPAYQSTIATAQLVPVKSD
jgi:hypothetical protein